MKHVNNYVLFGRLHIFKFYFHRCSSEKIDLFFCINNNLEYRLVHSLYRSLTLHRSKSVTFRDQCEIKYCLINCVYCSFFVTFCNISKLINLLFLVLEAANYAPS